jgi:ketosteroid isomerase-like protein
MTDDSMLLDHFHAQQLLNSYTRMVDARDLDGLAGIAHPDIVLVRSLDGERRGREAFLDLYRDFAASEVQDSQHMTTNLEVSAIGGGAVSMKSCFLAITTHPEGARMTWGRYDDEMAEHEGAWVLTAKRIVVTRTAVVGADMLAPLQASSFGSLSP